MGRRFTETALNQSNEKCTFDLKRKRLDFNSFQSPLWQQTIKDFYKPKGSHSENPHSCNCNLNNQNSSGIPKSETNSLEATSSLKKLFQWHKHPQSPKKNTAGHSSSTPGTPITTAVRIFMKCPSKVMQVIQRAMQAWSPSSTPDPDMNASSRAPGNIKQPTYQSKKKSKFKWFKSTKYSCFSLYTALATQNTSSPPKPLNVGWSFDTKHRKIYLKNAARTAKAHVQTGKHHLEFRQSFQ